LINSIECSADFLYQAEIAIYPAASRQAGSTA
jgi:hypothetical protein